MLMSELDDAPSWLRVPQATAIRHLERSPKGNRSRALIQMATGSGTAGVAILVLP